MFRFLLKFYIKGDYKHKSNREKVILLTGYMGLVINFILFLFKIVIGIMMNSISIIGDSFNNLSDTMTSIITIFGSIISSKPADEDHPFGHGRSEYIATLSVGISVFIVGIQLFKSSIQAIIKPEDIKFNIVLFIVLIISIFLKVYMYLYNLKTDKMIKSPMNRAAAIDSRNDVLATLVVVLSVFTYGIFGINIDGFAGLLISILVIKSGIEVFKDMGDILLGKDIEPKTIEEIRKIILSGKFVRGVHDIKVHDYGNGNLFGKADVEMPVNIDAYSVHEVIDDLEIRIKDELDIEISLHVDPCYCLEEDHFISQNCRVGNCRQGECIKNSK